MHAIVLSSARTEEEARQALDQLNQHPDIVGELVAAVENSRPSLQQRFNTLSNAPRPLTKEQTQKIDALEQLVILEREQRPVTQAQARKIEELKAAVGINANWLAIDEIQDLMSGNGDAAVREIAQNIRRQLGLPRLAVSPVVIQNSEWLRIGCNELTEEVCKSVHDLRQQGQPQTAVLYLGGTKQDDRGHWVAVHMIPDAASPGGVRAFVVDSMGGNQSNNRQVLQLLDVYRQGAVVPLPELLPAITRIQDADSLLNHDVRGRPQTRAHNSFNYLAQSCQLIQALQPELLEDGWCRNMYEQIQQEWLAMGVNEVTIGRHRIALADCPTLEQFVARTCQ